MQAVIEEPEVTTYDRSDLSSETVYALSVY